MAKGLGIVLMTFGHVAEAPGGGWMLPALEGATAWVYLFHMPAFFLLGGFTYRRGQPTRSFLGKKVRTLLVPYAIYSLYFLVKAAFMAPAGEMWSHVVAAAVDVYVYGRGLWFLAAYFVGELISHLVIDRLSFDGAPLGGCGLVLFLASYVLDAQVAALGARAPFEMLNGMRAAGLMCVGAVLGPVLPPKGAPSRRVLVGLLVLSGLAYLCCAVLCDAGMPTFAPLLPYALSALFGSLMLVLLSVLISSNPSLEHVGRVSIVYYVISPEMTNIVRVPLHRLIAVGLLPAPPVFVQWLVACAMSVAILMLSRPAVAALRRFVPHTLGMPARLSRSS